MNAKKKRTVIRNVLNILAFTHRRTPKDVDGRRWDVPCVVLCRSKQWRRWVHVRFDDGRIDLRHSRNVFAGNGASGEKKTPVFEALSKSGGKWWINASGVLERVATAYEVERVAIDAAPGDGWTLVDGAVYVSEQKCRPMTPGVPRGESEVERLDRERKAAALQARRDKRCAHAAAMLALHTQKMRREEKLVAKWTRAYAHAMKIKAGAK